MRKAGEHAGPEPAREAAPPGAIARWTGQAREQAVQGMFTAIARWYDLNNTLLSFGLHRRWKRLALRDVPPLPQGVALDVGAGTADLAILLARRFGPRARILAADLNLAMLQRGREKIAHRKLHEQVTCLRANAERLPYGDATVDVVTAGFCMRNVGDLMRSLGEIHRVLKPTGRFVCLEFSRPVSGWLRRLYDWYSFRLLPWIGTRVAGDTTGVYQYLPASIRTFPDQEGLRERLLKAGFREVRYRNLTGGIVAVHVAIK